MKKSIIITTASLLSVGLYFAVMFSPFNDYVFTSALKAVIFFFCPFMYFKVSKTEKFRSLFEKGSKKQTRRSFGLGLGIIAVIFGLFVVLKPFLDSEMITSQMDGYGVTSSNFIFVFIYIVIINAALEEIFFRGFIFKTLYDSSNSSLKKYAHIYSSLIFSLYHIPMLNGAMSFGIFVFLLFGLFVAGLIFNAIVVKCENIIGAIIVHISANIALNLIVVYYFLVLPK